MAPRGGRGVSRGPSPTSTSSSCVAAEPAAILLMGPTASGKSALAATLAGRFPVEILSVDSAQVYRGIDRGNAKPSAAEPRAVPHPLLDNLHPTQSHSSAPF